MAYNRYATNDLSCHNDNIGSPLSYFDLAHYDSPASGGELYSLTYGGELYFWHSHLNFYNGSNHVHGLGHDHVYNSVFLIMLLYLLQEKAVAPVGRAS